MTKSEIFKAAHALAKASVIKVGDYMVAFKYSLEQVYKAIKSGQKVTLEAVMVKAVKIAKEYDMKKLGWTRSVINGVVSMPTESEFALANGYWK